MSGSHRIRLQAAWSVTAGGRVWTRSFGRPTGIGAADRIWLVFERPPAGRALLNGAELAPLDGRAAVWRHDVTGTLQDRNELRLEVETQWPETADADRLPLPDALGAVSVEIEPDGRVSRRA